MEATGRAQRCPAFSGGRGRVVRGIQEKAAAGNRKGVKDTEAITQCRN
jgi:hypothetical protein